MKKTAILLAICALSLGSAMAARVVLSGNLTTNKTLKSTDCNIIQGCLFVKSGVTLTINAGTTVYMRTSITGAGSLIIERGGKINAAGTAAAPVIFTSGLIPRTRGDWGGIIIAGNAPNNQPGGVFLVEGPCVPISAGGVNLDDNSGTMTFVQINFAGIAASVDNEINSLTLASVGRGTTINNIQVNFANDDAFEWFGGNVNCKYLIAYNTKDDDFDTDFGYNGFVQFAVALRKDALSHDVSGSNGFESDNNNSTATGFAGNPLTRPVFSNVTLFGPRYCQTTAGLDIEYKDGVRIRRNSSLSTYNSIISSWSWVSSTAGLNITETQTVTNTGTGFINVSGVGLNFSFNSFHNNVLNSKSSTWTGGCTTSIGAWLAGNGSPLCSEYGNQFSVATLGYTLANICKDYCPSAPPSFVLTTTSLLPASFTGIADLNNTFLGIVTYRGAFGATDWTTVWTNWCLDSEINCTGLYPAPLRLGAIEDEDGSFLIVPNPSNGATYARFSTATEGYATVKIVNMNGQMVIEVNYQIGVGVQQLPFDVSGLAAGIYSVKVQTNAGETFTSKLSVD